MSYFEDYVEISDNIIINGVNLPETSEPVKITFNNISDGGRLADNIDYVGSLKGTKVNIELKWAYLNKQHFDIIFNATQRQYLNGGSFYMTITVPTYTPLGVQAYTGYFMSTFNVGCTDSTEKHELDSSYQNGGVNYDELHENVVVSFVQV